MEYAISVLIGYLAGSVPVAYLLLKRSKGIDITHSGTGNVGAMNAYEVTDSKKIGLTVLLFDLLKGLLGVYLPAILFHNFTCASLALMAAVFSHCFNPWLNFKGGRGLATAAGGMIILFPILLFTWLILWGIIYYAGKDIHLGNIGASVLSLLLMFFLAGLAYKYTYPRAESASELIQFSASIFLLIIIRHIEPLKELLKTSKYSYRKRR